MERNTLLAIVLSAVVLFSYQAIFSPPKKVETLNNSQVAATQNVSATNNTSAVISPKNESQSTNDVKKTVDYVVKTPDTEFSFTNMGGSLHKINFIGENIFPITDVLSIGGLNSVQYKGQQLDNKEVSLVYKGKELQINKSFKFESNNHINVRMEIKNLTKISILNVISFRAFKIDNLRMDINLDKNIDNNSREIALYEYSVYAKNKIFRHGNAYKFNNKNDKSETGKINWVGFRNRYYAFVVKPEFETKGYEIKSDGDKRLNVSISPVDKILAPGESVAYNFSIYAGPQNPWLMRKYHQGFEKIVAFSNFAIIEWLAQAIYHTIPILHGIVRSWGLAIILISCMIYGITYPLTMKSTISMRKMQEVAPKIKALQERFKNDPQKIQAETMEIYRREKINPFGGCLPMLIQMPFFLALYQILWRAQYFQGQGFLWIKDLSQPDRLMILPFSLPFFGNELNILPILTGSIMFLQQKISSKNMVVTDEQQAMQQKMMMYFLPVLMSCMFYHFASSWAIYFLVYYIFSTVTQLRIAKLLGKK